MDIDVRPTPALRRHRARIAGALVAVAVLALAVLAVAELAGVGEHGTGRVPVSDVTHP